jgi:hypothetical protein
MIPVTGDPEQVECVDEAVTVRAEAHTADDEHVSRYI